ncbi:hypothetical protein [Paludibaculum fermentans]|uniref:hypothetical protein n=1 Tax=Paludibaculum fermentans TaxID=1473598 RepID=UPI003EB8B249
MVTVILLVAALLGAGGLLFARLHSRTLRITAVVCTLAALAWSLRPAARHLFQQPAAVLLDQLGGYGCSYQDEPGSTPNLNPLTELSIRHPDYFCPMWAADHLAASSSKFKLEPATVAAAFETALRRKPEQFDTGDGIIPYGAHLKAARQRLLPPK